MKFFLSPGSQSVPLTSELTLFAPKTIIKEGLLFPVVFLGVVGYIYPEFLGFVVILTLFWIDI